MRCRPIRPMGLADSVRLVVADDAPRDDPQALDIAVQAAVEEALERSAPKRSLVRAHERRRGRAATIAGIAVSAARVDDRVAAAAATDDLRVGLSLEREGRLGAAYDRFFLTSAERRLLAEVGRTALFTLKEAAWKALSVLLEGPGPPDLELHFDRSGALRVATVRSHGVSVRGTLAAPWAGYVLGVVWTEPVRVVSGAKRKRRTGA